MNRGRVVLSGPVAELVESQDTTVLALDGGDPVAAAALLGRLPGVTSATVETDGRLLVVGDAPRSRLVSALVGGGHAVSAVDGRRHLEEVFMQLIGEAQPVREPVREPGYEPVQR
jgi:ABC-2 type transport system ATP-binding protein